MVKLCSACKLVKDGEKFGRNKSRPDGKAVWCKACCSASAHRRWIKDPEAGRAKASRYYRENKERHLEWQKRWLSKNQERVRLYQREWRLAKRGMSLDSYAAILESQDGKCGICGKTQGRRKLAVDHDHACHSGYKESCAKCIRGLLCGPCNTALHRMENDVEWHVKALAYLSRYKEKENGRLQGSTSAGD